MVSGALSLSTDIRPPRALGPDAILRAAAEAGANGIHLGAGFDLEQLGLVVSGAARIGLEISSATLPLPEGPLPRGRRLPRLGAVATDERTAAIALAERGLTGVGGSARAVLLDFGPIELATPPSGIARAFTRRALDDEEDDSGARLLSAAREERRARSGQVMDACRWATEALLRTAERVGVTVVLPVGPTPWDAPSPREAGELLELFAGARVGAAWDPGRLSVLCALGLPLSDERLRALAEGAVLAVENDAVGLRAGYLPGLGERDARVAALSAPSSVPVVIAGDAEVTDAEVLAAVAALAARASRAPAPAAAP